MWIREDATEFRLMQVVGVRLELVGGGRASSDASLQHGPLSLALFAEVLTLLRLSCFARVTWRS